MLRLQHSPGGIELVMAPDEQELIACLDLLVRAGANDICALPLDPNNVCTRASAELKLANQFAC